MKRVTLTIDGTTVTAPEGTTVLFAALDNGIYIPNLCALRGEERPAAACRLCFVEVQGKANPVTSCTEPVQGGIVVNTRSEQALRLARSAFRLIMSAHTVQCARCAQNGQCELQKIAHHLKVPLKPAPYQQLPRALPLDTSHSAILYDPNKCVLCERCVRICRDRGNGILGFARRGFDRMMTTFADKPLGEFDCADCLACVDACPVGALTRQNKLSRR